VTAQRSVRAVVRTWTPIAIPIIAAAALALVWGSKPGVVIVLLLAVVLIGAILTAVHHAEVIAHRVGEPIGSLLLAVAVTVIEVGLIVTLSAGDHASPTLARDTVFSAFMITTTGVIGLSIVVGARRYRTVRFQPEGSGAALATLSTLAVLCLVLPNYTETAGPVFSPAQLAFAGVASFALYVLFIVTQTVSHRSMFLPVGEEIDDEYGADDARSATDAAHVPSTGAIVISAVLLLVSLLAVVGLAKVESPAIEGAVSSLGLPESVVGVIIALVILLPESISAVVAAQRNKIQTSLNLGLGSAMASIGLTIPAVAVASIWLPGQLTLGLGPVQIVLMTLAIIVSILTVVPGRATLLQGGVHLGIFAAFLFLSVAP
jgi:Ca2+:H+ antiporter